MRIDQLRYLIVLAESQSIIEASEKLHISYQALGIFLKKAENEFNVKIFSRSKNGISVTEEGDRVINFARKTLKEYQDICDPLHRRQDSLFIYAMLVYEISITPIILAENKWKGVLVHNYTLPEVIMKLKSDICCGKRSIGLVNFNKKNLPKEEKNFAANGLCYREIFTSKICIIVGKNSQVAQKNDFYLDNIVDSQTIAFGTVTDDNLMKLVNLNNCGISTDSYNMWINYILQKNMIGIIYDIALMDKAPLNQIIDDLKILRLRNEIEGTFGLLMAKDAPEDMQDLAEKIYEQIKTVVRE